PDSSVVECAGKSPMRNVQESKISATNYANEPSADVGRCTVDVGQITKPTTEELAVLSWFERFAFRLVRRMNRGRWKRFWTWCQKVFGAGWIHLSTSNLMNVYGLEHNEDADRT